MSKMIIRIFFQSVGPDEADTVEDGDCDVLLLLLNQDEEDDEEDEDSLGILESAVEENKLNAEELADGDFSTVPRAALSFGSSSINCIFDLFIY
jgi:hypothetical protein